MKGTLGRVAVIAGFLFAIGLLLVIAGYGYAENRAASEARSMVIRSFQVRQLALELENAITLMEARHRAFLVGGNAAFLERREASHSEALAVAQRVAALVSDESLQLRRLQRVLSTLAAFHAVMQANSALAQRDGIEAARAGFHAFGSGSIDPIREALKALGDEEERLLEQRRARSDRRAARFDLLLLYGTGLAVLLLSGSALALHRQLHQVESMGTRLSHINAVQSAMLDGAGLMIFGVRPGGEIHLFNRAASEALGYAPDEVIGHQTLVVFHDPDEVAARASQLSTEVGQPIDPGFGVFTANPDRGLLDTAEWTFVRKDGSRFPVELVISAVRGLDGSALGYVGMALDLTRRNADEVAIRKLNDELTAQAEDLARTNQELESFSSSVSHDLRAPLRHIDGYARMLIEDSAERLDPESRRYLDTIALSARRMGTLIDDLLAFSRLGRTPLIRQRVDMQALAEDVRRDLRVSPDSVLIDELPAAMGDPSLLRQVWMNLLSNAVKYSAPRGANARIEVSGNTNDGRSEYRIQDNGVGFDMKYRDKLFGVFQRLHSQDEFEGTGVGLAIVYRILRRHDGHIDAVAEPGRGATFSFELPSEETEHV